ncbi:MAG: 3'-5' exonuclease domain-containing protein 2 [Opitutales bacterium]|jgi:ribonuclease D|nr:3'-5' exonuclease domain-containing protein 2 [Opitutales bacterium]MDB2499234.1 3'-5' exonuclease domain-containing protein 2 [bacterium]MDG2166899.1 3'-5' exonuclease domain-containing protein 2 [Opitutales bacterium]
MENTNPNLENSTITREEINALPLMRFEGPIHVIDQKNQVQAAVERLLQEKVLGFDTETKPSFKKGVSYPPALIQFATQEEAWLFRINGKGIHKSILDLLQAEATVKVGVALHDDIKHLQKVRKFNPSGFMDVASVANDAGILKRGLRNMTGILLGGRLSKSAQLTNWAQSTLTPNQLAYAATDAWVSLKLYLKFQELELVS